MDYSTLKEILTKKIMVLDEFLWEGRAKSESIERWLSNFKSEKEKIHCLFLISQFTYFGSRQVRNSLVSLYRDIYKYQKIEKIRKSLTNSTDIKKINDKFKKQLNQTRFLGIGNPSESGTHMLYYFRQENKLSKNLFINVYDIFTRGKNKNLRLKYPRVNNYVFIDDFCGSGSQAKDYSKNIVTEIKRLSKNIKVDYLMLIGTQKGLNEVRKLNFDNVEAVFTLDDSFKTFDNDSRYFRNIYSGIDQKYAEKLCKKHGKKLMYYYWQREGIPNKELNKYSDATSLGFGDCQLLLGFHHNIPDNTLPIIWYDEGDTPWIPIFKRYNKNYSIVL